MKGIQVKIKSAEIWSQSGWCVVVVLAVRMQVYIILEEGIRRRRRSIRIRRREREKKLQCVVNLSLGLGHTLSPSCRPSDSWLQKSLVNCQSRRQQQGDHCVFLLLDNAKSGIWPINQVKRSNKLPPLPKVESVKCQFAYISHGVVDLQSKFCVIFIIFFYNKEIITMTLLPYRKQFGIRIFQYYTIRFMCEEV